MAGSGWRFLRRIADHSFALAGEDPLLGEVAAKLYSGARAAAAPKSSTASSQRRGPTPCAAGAGSWPEPPR
ncbi:MAG: hypothetical protein FJY95_06625 [Candidatus Handelsmanbacteria bacterium]|nr:hypothetical protein [Candidatus Handelsmanbacteria bacterium]